MRAFTCQNCQQLVFFENSECLRCHSSLGFVPARRSIVALHPGERSGALVAVDDRSGHRRCMNAGLAACNWVVPDHDPNDLCDSCRLTRKRPADEDEAGMQAFAAAEEAKRRLMFQLLELGLPIVSREDDPVTGLAFDLLSSKGDKVYTGHENGVVTLDLAESDHVYRTQVREKLGEVYRTVLGHLRHEIGHYFWTVLIEHGGPIGHFRTLFGDETISYDDELKRHYAEGPPLDWREHFVSSYATMHPWEDWAETFAHYLHIRDTLQTAAAFGVSVTGPRVATIQDRSLAVTPTEDLQDERFEQVVADWLALTYALNAVNRSMGKEDLYPFVLSPTVIDKLSFVHEQVNAAARAGANDAAAA